jgi:hypothetical protein
MSEIVRLSEHERKRRVFGPVAGSGADLLLFTGVRYVREETKLRPSAKMRAKSRNKRA